MVGRAKNPQGMSPFACPLDTKMCVTHYRVMKNRVRAMREKRGLTQRALADAIGTSQQQIQRLETDATSVKLDIALRVCDALEAELSQLFPGTRQLVGTGKQRKSRKELVELHYDSAALRTFNEAGIDLDPATWILKLRLRGGTTPTFVIATAEAERLRRNLEDRSSSSSFFVFNSSLVVVALNWKHLLHYHELWDGHVDADWHDPAISSEDVSVYLADSPTPLLFDAYPDEGDPQSDNDTGRLRGLLFELETFLEPGEFVSFMDTDGEHAFFRADDVALMTIPLRLVNEQLNADMVEAEEDEADGAESDDRSEDISSGETGAE
jgi:transcriptional regulator with XRE-family HTH domain